MPSEGTPKNNQAQNKQFVGAEQMPKTDIGEFQTHIYPLLGQKAWGVSLGIGSFITLEFGNILPRDENHQSNHGEWHLWIYCCGWRLEENNEVLAASEDTRSKLENAVQRLEGLAIESIQRLNSAGDTVFTFEQQIILRTFSIYSEEFEHWMLYMPDGNVLSTGPGSGWSYESSRAVPASA